MTETIAPILSRTELGRSPVAKAIALGGVLTGRAMAKEHEKVTTRISIISPPSAWEKKVGCGGVGNKSGHQKCKHRCRNDNQHGIQLRKRHLLDHNAA